MVRSFEIEPVLMTQPMAEKKNKATPVWSGFERQQKLNDIIREVGVKYGVLIIDLDKHMNSLEDFKENPFKYLYDGVHVSDAGSTEYATYIHKALTK